MFKQKEYESLAGRVEKYPEEYPYDSVPNYWMGNLSCKLGRQDESLQYLIASLDFGLPTEDLRKSAEYELASLLLQGNMDRQFKRVLLQREEKWWSEGSSHSIFQLTTDGEQETFAGIAAGWGKKILIQE